MLVLKWLSHQILKLTNCFLFLGNESDDNHDDGSQMQVASPSVILSDPELEGL